jgi:hypothetical protein
LIFSQRNVHRRSEKSSSAHSTLKRPNKTGRFNKDQWEREQPADQDDEIGLKRKLIICSACSADESGRDNATSSIR